MSSISENRINTDIPVFCPPAKGRWDEETLKRSILKANRNFDLTKIRSIWLKNPKVSTLNMADIKSALDHDTFRPTSTGEKENPLPIYEGIPRRPK